MNTMVAGDILKEIIKNKDVKFLCKWLFNVDITDKQAEIIRAIAFKEHRRIIITAYTRYGKSFSVALGVLLYILFNKNKRILLVAPIFPQAGILRNYITEFIVNSELFREELISLSFTGIDRLRKEVNKGRITFNNGCELTILSASGTAERLMGWGGDLIILDESCLIPFEVYRQKISRMLGDSKDSILVEIGNPWHKHNQMWEHWKDPNFYKIHIPWQVGVKEGRIKEEFIEEQRRMLTEQEFKILYDAEFPEDTENTLIKWKWIEDATSKTIQEDAQPDYEAIGVDVAGMGEDLTVLIHIKRYGDVVKVERIKSWSKLELSQVAGNVIQYMEQNNIKNAIIDETGIGGLASLLKEHNPNWNIKGVNFGAGATQSNCLNMKAEIYYNLMNLFKDGKIIIPKHQELIMQLSFLEFEITSNGKIKIIDNQEKSPDFADALALACYMKQSPQLVLGSVRRIL